MKVCVVTTSYPRYEGDFAGAFLLHICQELEKLGVEVTVVAPNDTQSKRYERHGNVTIRRFNYFFKSYQKIAYGYGGIPVNLKSNPWLVFLLPFFLFPGIDMITLSPPKNWHESPVFSLTSIINS